MIAGGFGLVPEIRQHTSGSGDVFETVLWKFFELPATPAVPVPCPNAVPSVGSVSYW